MLAAGFWGRADMAGAPGSPRPYRATDVDRGEICACHECPSAPPKDGAEGRKASDKSGRAGGNAGAPCRGLGSSALAKRNGGSPLASGVAARMQTLISIREAAPKIDPAQSASNLPTRVVFSARGTDMIGTGRTLSETRLPHNLNGLRPAPVRTTRSRRKDDHAPPSRAAPRAASGPCHSGLLSPPPSGSGGLRWRPEFIFRLQ